MVPTSKLVQEDTVRIGNYHITITIIIIVISVFICDPGAFRNKVNGGAISA